MRHRISGVVLAAVLLAPGGSAQGGSHWPGGLGKHHGKFWKKSEIRQQLELTEDEVRDLENIFARKQRELVDLEADVKKKRAELDAALNDDQADDPQVIAGVDRLEQVRANLGKARVMMLLEMRRILTPAQREKLAQLREDHQRKQR